MATWQHKQDADWIPYSQEDNELIENAFQKFVFLIVVVFLKNRKKTKKQKKPESEKSLKSFFNICS